MLFFSRLRPRFGVGMGNQSIMSALQGSVHMVPKSIWDIWTSAGNTSHLTAAYKLAVVLSEILMLLGTSL